MLTKIVATLGPASDSPEMVRKLIDAGVGVFRLNFSHGTLDDHARRLATVREAAKDLRRPTAVLGDLQGPKIRVGMVPDPGIDLPTGGEVVIRHADEPSSRSGSKITLTTAYQPVVSEVEPGQRVLINDGAVRLLAIERRPRDGKDELVCRVTVGGLDVVRALHLRGDTRPVVLLTSGIGDADLLAALDLGVQGIVTKDSAAELLPLCLQHVARGGQWIEPTLLQRALSLARHGAMMDDRRARMTPRERIMAELVTRGLRNRDIAAELGVSEATVKVTIHRLFEKLGLQNRVELALMMRREGGDPHDERLDVTSSALGRMAEASMPGC